MLLEWRLYYLCHTAKFSNFHTFKLSTGPNFQTSKLSKFATVSELSNFQTSLITQNPNFSVQTYKVWKIAIFMQTGSPPVPKPGWSKGPCGTTSQLKIQFDPPKRSAQNTILSAQKAPAGRFSGSKYNFICPKGPCGTTFCYSWSEMHDIGPKSCFFIVLQWK